MSIRTTITLDNDVYERLKQASAAKGESFRDVVNEVIRLGFLSQERNSSGPPLQIRPRPMGVPKIPITKVEDVLEALEGPLHR